MRQNCRAKIILAVFILTGLVLITCGRYEEGPLISFRKAETRLNGKWEVTSFLMNDIDCTAAYQNRCNGRFSFSHSGTSDESRVVSLMPCKPDDRALYGYYDIHSDILEIEFIHISGHTDSTLNWNSRFAYFAPICTQESIYWTIIKLKYKEMKLSCFYKDTVYKISFIKYDLN